MRKRILAVLLGTVFLLSLVGCNEFLEEDETEPLETEQTTTTKRTTTTTTMQKKDIKVPGICYSSTDSLSPYQSTTRVNQQLWSLLYEGLTIITNDWQTTNGLAQSIQKQNANTYVATLRKNAKFSDGTAVTPSHVVSSFQLAKRSASFASLVADIQSVRASKDNTVTITFSSAVPWAERALSFPVVNGTLGSGPYVYSKKQKMLVASQYRETPPTIAKWRLEDVSRRYNQQYALESGQVQYYFTDLEENEIARVTTTVSVNPVEIPYLIFMGINTGRSTWQKTVVRKGLSAAISRKAVGAAGCAGYANPATSIFPSSVKGVSQWEGFAEEAQVGIAVDAFEKAEINNVSADLVVPSSNKTLVNAAKEIASELKKVGINVNIRSLEAGSFRSCVSNGNYDFYLGEIRLPNTLSLDTLLQSGGAGSSGITSTGKADYQKYRSGQLDAKAFHEAFLQEIPLIPLVWEQGLSMASADLTGVTTCGADAYYQVQNWKWK